MRFSLKAQYQTFKVTTAQFSPLLLDFSKWFSSIASWGRSWVNLNEFQLNINEAGSLWDKQNNERLILRWGGCQSSLQLCTLYVVIIGRLLECCDDRWGKLSTSSGISRLEITGLVRPGLTSRLTRIRMRWRRIGRLTWAMDTRVGLSPDLLLLTS